ncbi:MAG: TIR domain-containing protein [Candidatus Methanofastidiosia archaeon]
MIRIKGKLMVCLLTCPLLCIPAMHGVSQSWSYRIDGITTTAMTHDGQNIIVGSSSGVYYLLNGFGELLAQDNLDSEIRSVDICKENIILGTRSATFILDLSGKIVTQFPSEPVLCVAISENGSSAISGAEKNIFFYPTLESGMQLYVGTPVNHVSISSTGKEAAAATSDKVFFYRIDGTITYWEYEIPSITSIQVSRDGRFLVVGTKQGTLYLLGKNKYLHFKKDLVGPFVSVDVTEDMVIAGSSSGRIYLFSTNGTEIASFLVDKMVGCDISQNGKFIAAASTQRFYMYNEKGELLWQKGINGIKSVEISSDGGFVSVSTDKGILFFRNWGETFNGTHYFPYPSRGIYSFENFKKIGEYPVSPILVPYIRQPYKRIAVGDVNGDGNNEIVASIGEELIIFDSEMNVLSKKSYESDVFHITLMDLDNDTIPEITCSLSDGWYRIFVLRFNNGELQEADKFDFTSYLSVSQKDRMEAAIAPVVSYDIDEDGKTEILAVINSGYTRKPRGILAFEYPSGTVEWFYKSASSVVIDAFCDIDNDDKPEVVLGSHACCNGNTQGQRDDCHAYLVVLDLGGNEVWSKEVASELKTVRVGVDDINNDGKVEIVGTINDAQNVYGSLFVRDNKGNMLYEQELSSVFYLGGIADFDKDGYKEIVVTDPEGNISIYSSRLRLEKKHEITAYQLCEVEGINDMDGDGNLEIVVKVWDGHVVILDSNLEEEWNRAFDQINNVLVANVWGCGNDLFILTLKSFEFFSFEGKEEYLCARFMPGSAGIAESVETSELTPTETPKPIPSPTESPPITSPMTTTTSSPPPSPTNLPQDEWDLEKVGAIFSIVAIPLAILIFLYQERIREYWRRGEKFKIAAEEVSSSKEGARENIIDQGSPRRDFEFDIAISFAGEDREIAEELAKELWARGVEVFYDRFFKGKIWGKELTKYFQEVYGPKTKYVVLLLSKHYPVKKWTGFEFSIMREEAERRETEFILPVKLDSTEMKGVKKDVAYLDFREEGIVGIINCLMEKIPEVSDEKQHKEDIG